MPMAYEPKVLVMVLAGGEGKRLLPLTNDRAKPAVPFGGTYRIIDFALSNFANARYLKIVVLTQYKSHSLDRHISQTWRFSTLLDNYVTPVPAQMRRGPQWFQGSADAIYQNLNLIYDERPDYVAVFGADHIYRMDPRQMVDQHIASGAGVTVAAIPVDRDEAHQLGVIEADESGLIKAFHEKSDSPPGMPGDDTRCLASMGNYVFNTQTLIDIVTPNEESPLIDMGGDVIPALTAQGQAHVYDFSTNVVPGQDDANAATGETSEPLTRCTTQIWISLRQCQCSTSTTSSGRYTPTERRYLPQKCHVEAWESRHLLMAVFCVRGPSSRAPMLNAQLCRQACLSTTTLMSLTRS